MTVISVSPISTPQPAFKPVQSFTEKLINVSVTLPSTAALGAPSKFSGQYAAGNVLSFSGYRTSARITVAGRVNGGMIDIFGLPLDTINSLSMVGQLVSAVQNNSILISAGDAESGVTPVFSGNIMYAYVFGNQPDVSFHMEFQAGGIWQALGVPPTSIAGNVSVANLFRGFAQTMQLEFENNGVTSTLSNPYLRGTLVQQMNYVSRHAHVAYVFTSDKKLAIFPFGGSRKPTTIPLISPTTGMIGYPSFAGISYMAVDFVFNPQVTSGSQIQVESSLVGANKTWVIGPLTYALDSLVPEGEWRMHAICSPLGAAMPPPAPGY